MSKLIDIVKSPPEGKFLLFKETELLNLDNGSITPNTFILRKDQLLFPLCMLLKELDNANKSCEMYFVETGKNPRGHKLYDMYYKEY